MRSKNLSLSARQEAMRKRRAEMSSTNRLRHVGSSPKRWMEARMRGRRRKRASLCAPTMAPGRRLSLRSGERSRERSSVERSWRSRWRTLEDSVRVLEEREEVMMELGEEDIGGAGNYVRQVEEGRVKLSGLWGCVDVEDALEETL